MESDTRFPPRLLTVEQYAQLPEEQTMLTELIEGEIVRISNGEFWHETVKSNAAEILIMYTFQNPIGRVFCGSMYKLGPQSGPIPDVSLLLQKRLARQDRAGFLEGAPDLAFEVVCSESAALLEHKINLFLENGCQVFWVAYPQERTLLVRRPFGDSKYLREGEYLEEPNLLPGFRVLVDRFFDGI
jgi:Uma2 family endonuclease